MTVALVTGATRGIGKETARMLVERGYDVYVGARDPRRGEQVAAEIGARWVPLDVTDDASVTAALAAVEATEGRLDLLVNNAGVLDTGEPDGPRALRTFDTNVVGVVRVTQAALPLLRRSPQATVVTVSSSAGSFWASTTPERPEYHLRAILYAASKAAASMLTLQYAKAEPGVRFTAVEPGYTATDMTASMAGGRDPQDSARVVVRAATDPSAAPTGTLTDEDGALAW